MKKLLLLCPVLVALVFMGAMCSSTSTNTNTNVAPVNTANMNTAAEATLTLSKAVYEPGEDITVTVKNYDQYGATAWVGVIPVDIAHGEEGLNDENDSDYEYLSGSEDGVVILSAPTVVGKYDVRFNSDDDSTIGKEITFTTFEVVE